MARCEGITRNGEQCKLDARPGSRFCHLHDPGETGEGEEEEARAEGMEWDEVVPLLLAGVAVLGFLVALKALGRWIPR